MDEKYHKVNLKEQILYTAFELIEKYGYKQVSIRLIARRLNISSAAIYRHYESRDDLFCSVIEFVEMSFAEYLLKDIDENTDSVDVIKQVSWNILEFSLERTNLYDLIFREEELAPKEGDELGGQVSNQGLEIYVESMSRLIDEYDLDVDVKDLFMLYWSFLVGYSKLVRYNKFSPNKELVMKSLVGIASAHKRD